MNTLNKLNGLSIVVPVCERTELTIELYQEYKEECEKLADVTEFIYVISADEKGLVDRLKATAEQDNKLCVVVLNRNYGEATAIQAGVHKAAHPYILTLPPYKQVATEELHRLVENIEGVDIALGKRSPRLDGGANKLQNRVFKYFVGKLSEQNFEDLGCGVRLVRRQVFEETTVYGDQWRFFPLLTFQRGFRSVEVPLTQAQEDAHSRVYNPGLYIRRLLDLITIVFLTKFNKKPLRFFGLIGTSSIVIGLLGLIYLAFERLVLEVPLADRPLLVLFSLFFVLGCQLMAIGLVGETFIFSNAKSNPEYRVREIVE